MATLQPKNERKNVLLASDTANTQNEPEFFTKNIDDAHRNVDKANTYLKKARELYDIFNYESDETTYYEERTVLDACRENINTVRTEVKKGLVRCLSILSLQHPSSYGEYITNLERHAQEAVFHVQEAIRTFALFKSHLKEVEHGEEGHIYHEECKRHINEAQIHLSEALELCVIYLSGDRRHISTNVLHNWTEGKD